MTRSWSGCGQQKTRSSQRDKNVTTGSQYQWPCNTTTTSWGHRKTNPSGFSSMGAHFITILVLTLCNTGQTSEALHHSLLLQQGASHGWTNNATSTCLELFSQMDISTTTCTSHFCQKEFSPRKRSGVSKQMWRGSCAPILKARSWLGPWDISSIYQIISSAFHLWSWQVWTSPWQL